MTQLDTQRIRAYRHFGKTPPEPSIFQKVAATLRASEAETLTLLRENYPLVIDLSHWTGHVDFSLLKGKVDGVFTKACELEDGDAQAIDDRLADNIQGAYDIDVPAGMYIFGNPQAFGSGMSLNTYLALTPDNDKEIAMMREAAKHKTYNLWGIDEERWWISYDEYWQYQQGKIPQTSVRKIGPAWLNAHFRELSKRAKAAFPDKGPVCYSGKWFVDGYCRDGANVNPYDWSGQFPWWGAGYTTTGKKLLWDAIKSIYPPDSAKPPDFNSTTLFWQFGYASLPVEVVNGVTRYASVDLNLWMGGYGYPTTKQGMRDWFGYVPRGDPVTPPAPPVPAPVDLQPVMDKLTAMEKELHEIRSVFK